MFQTRRTLSSKALSSREQKLAEYLKTAKSQTRKRVFNPFYLIRGFPTVVSKIFARSLSVVGKVPLYILVSTIMSSLTFFGYSYFTIQKIVVTKNTEKTIPLKGMADLIGQSMILKSTGDIENLLSKANPDRSRIKVLKLFPQTLSIEAESSQPVLIIKIHENQYILLDSNAKVIRITFEQIERVPTLYYYQKLVSTDYAVGIQIPYSDMKVSAQIASLLLKYGYTDFSITIDDTARIEVNWKGTYLIFSNKSDISRQIATLDEFMRVLTRGTDQYKKVDFRFDRVITER